MIVFRGLNICRTSVPVRQHKAPAKAIGAFVIVEQTFSITIEILNIETELVPQFFVNYGQRNAPIKLDGAKIFRP